MLFPAPPSLSRKVYLRLLRWAIKWRSGNKPADTSIVSTPIAPEVAASSLSEQPKETHHVRISKGVGAFLLSVGFTAVVALVIGAFQIAGVVNMGLAHMVIALAWVTAVFAVWLWLLSRPRKHVMKTVLAVACASGIGFFGIDRLMVSLKAEQERANSQPPSVSATPLSLTPSPSPGNTAAPSLTPMPQLTPLPRRAAAIPKPRSKRSQAEAAEAERLRQQRLLRDLGFDTP